MTSVGPESPDSHSRQRVVDIYQMRSELLELVDQYDVIAHELRRMQIPLKKSWEANQSLATSRLQTLHRMVELDDRARAERLSLVLGESKLSAAQINVLDAEVASLAALLSTCVGNLRTNITAMQSAADAARDTPHVSHAAPPPPPAPSELMDSVVLPTAANELDPAAAPDSAARQTQRKSRGLQRRTEMLQNAALRAESYEREHAAAGLQAGHSVEDCTATTADYGEWRLSPRLLQELFPVNEWRQAKNILFVEWSIRHMAITGQRQPMKNGTRPCGGYTKDELFLGYKAANPGALPIADSVFNNRRVPAMGVLWAIATELRTNTQKSLSGTSSLEDAATLPGNRVNRTAAGPAGPAPPGRRRRSRSTEFTDPPVSDYSEELSQDSNHSDSGPGSEPRQASKKGRTREGAASGDNGHSGLGKRRACENDPPLPPQSETVKATRRYSSLPPAVDSATDSVGGGGATAAACESAAAAGRSGKVLLAG